MGPEPLHPPARKTRAVALAIALILAGCGGSGGGSSDDGNAGQPVAAQLECDAIEVTVNADQPLARVALTGLSGAEPTSDWVQVRVAGQPDYATALYGNVADGYEVLVPIHPEGAVGGPVELSVTNGDDRCPAIAFDVLPLTPHTGNPVAELASAMDAMARALADRYGVEPATLAATPLNELPVPLIPLAVAFTALEAADYDAALADLEPEQRNLLQDLIARLDLPDRLLASTTAIRRLPVAPAAATTAGASTSATTADRRTYDVSLARVTSARAALRAEMQTAAGDAFECQGLGAVSANHFGIDTPEKLAEYMKAARGAADTVGPLRQGVDDLNSALAILGLVPGGGGLGFKVAGFIGGAAAFTLQVLDAMRANLYPSFVDRVQFAVTEDRIPEDWIRTKDGAIEWQVATLYPQNWGMNITRAIVDGSMFLFTSAQNELVGASGLLSKAAERGVGAAQFIDGGKAIDSRLDQLQADGDSRVVECFDIGATEFTPVVVPDNTGAKWVRGVVRSGQSIALDDREILPQQIGASTLRVETNTDNLPGARAFGDRSIEVLRKAVVWLPANLFVEKTNNRETVKVRFDNARHTDFRDVAFKPDPALIDPQELGTGAGPEDGLYEVSFTTPEDKTLYPLEYEARSTSGELPPAMPARAAKLIIRTRETITISPRTGCVANGDNLRLVATVSSTDDSPQVTWERVSGQGPVIFGGDGLVASYTAPNTGGGRVTIRATLEQPAGFSGEPVEDEVTFSYGPCADVAVFYDVAGEYTLPGVAPGCTSPGDSGDEFSDGNDNADNDGKNPEIPLSQADFWGPGQRFFFDESLADTGNRGNGAPDRCSSGVFPAALRNQTEVRIPVDAGNVVVYDIDLDAEARCDTFGDGARGCSSASAFSGVWTRYALEVKTATEVRVELDLLCSDNRASGVPTSRVELFFTRTNENGVGVAINRDSEAFVPPVRSEICVPGNPVALDYTFPADEPETPGTVDTITVLIVTGTSAAADPEIDGQEQIEASLTGNVRVREVPN